MSHTPETLPELVDQLHKEIEGKNIALAKRLEWIRKVEASNADLLAALKAALPYLEHSVKFYRYQQAGHEFWPNREEAEGNITEARAAIEKAESN